MGTWQLHDFAYPTVTCTWCQPRDTSSNTNMVVQSPSRYPLGLATSAATGTWGVL